MLKRGHEGSFFTLYRTGVRHIRRRSTKCSERVTTIHFPHHTTPHHTTVQYSLRLHVSDESGSLATSRCDRSLYWTYLVRHAFDTHERPLPNPMGRKLPRVPESDRFSESVGGFNRTVQYSKVQYSTVQTGCIQSGSVAWDLGRRRFCTRYCDL